MADSSRSSYLEDPLHSYSGLSLFSRTLKSKSISLPHDYQSEDPQQTHTILESMPFEEEHLEQAKAILEDSSEFLKEGSGTSVATEAPKMIPIPNKRERRQGLDRKRGHFSFKPTISQSPQNKPTFDPKKYPKPEDYFAAYEVYENALRQWEKYKGTSVTDTHQNQPSRRPRRPGMPGRKRAPFTLTITENCLSAINLEDSEKENPDPSELSLERSTAAHVTTADRQVDDSTVDTDKNIDNLLTKLLACKGDELEGDGAVKLLEKGLDMKLIDTGKLTFPDISKMNLKASVSSPSNRRNPLSDIHNVLKGSNSVAARKNRQSPSSNPSEDQFLFTDRLPADKQPIEVDPAKDLNICYIPSNVDCLHVADLLKSSVQKSSYEDGSDTDSGIHIFHRSPEGSRNNDVGDSIRSRNSATLVENADIQTNGDEGEVAMTESDYINEKTDQLDSEAEDPSREVARKDLFTLEDDSIRYQQGESPKSPEQYNTTDECFEQAEHIQEQHGHENNNTDTASGVQVESAQQEVHNISPERTNKRSRESCDNNREKRSKTVGDESEGDKQMETLPRESGAEKQTKTKSKERVEKKKQMKTVTRESKIFSRRTSLAGAGTKWESGMRRSTRIKSRPLEFWKGERFLYGRIHESLSTVIGIKYASPDEKTGKRELKVKSYVSDDYKEMLDFAALH